MILSREGFQFSEGPLTKSNDVIMEMLPDVIRARAHFSTAQATFRRMDHLHRNFDLAKTALFLDIDGTLLEIQNHPDAVVSSPALRELLAKITRRLDGALALISGRPIAEIDRIFDPLMLPAAGGHGVEIRYHDSESIQQTTVVVPRALMDRLRAFVDVNPGLLLEPKPNGVALHYRRRPDLAAAVAELLAQEARLLDGTLNTMSGKMVVEFVPHGYDKGGAIRSFLGQAPFRGRSPVFVGDDVTDEAGFAVVNNLGGHSFRIGGNRDSAAMYSLADVRTTQSWLATLVDGTSP